MGVLMFSDALKKIENFITVKFAAYVFLVTVFIYFLFFLIILYNTVSNYSNPLCIALGIIASLAFLFVSVSSTYVSTIILIYIIKKDEKKAQ